MLLAYDNRGFQKTMLAASVFLLALLITAAFRLVGPTVNADPVHRAIHTASQLTDTANDELIRDWLFTLVLSEREEFAYTFARRTASDAGRFQAYIFIADALMKVGKTAEAQKALQKASLAAMSISPPDVQLSALAKLAAQKSDIDEAFNKIHKIIDTIIRSNTLSDICITLIKAGNFDAATRAAHDDVIEWDRPRLLVQMGGALLEAGQPERARSVAQEALDLVECLQSVDDYSLKPLASVLVKVGLGDELLNAFRRLEKRNIYISGEAFESIAIGFAKSGATVKALAVARGITSFQGDERARALASVSQVLREAGRKDEAELILTEALEAALRIDFPAHRSWALYKIAPILVRAGRADEALRAVQSIGLIDNEPLPLIAVALAESGKFDEARHVTAVAFTRTNKFEHTIIRSGALIALVKAELKAGRVDEARRFVEVSRRKLAGIKDPDFVSDSSGLVAEALAMVKEWDQAVATAELCEQQIDRLAACTAIVREYSIAHNPSLEDVFRRAVEIR
jgi:tetratricopeptide (TPR) repeat protein